MRKSVKLKKLVRRLLIIGLAALLVFVALLFQVGSGYLALVVAAIAASALLLSIVIHLVGKALGRRELVTMMCATGIDEADACAVDSKHAIGINRTSRCISLFMPDNSSEDQVQSVSLACDTIKACVLRVFVRPIQERWIVSEPKKKEPTYTIGGVLMGGIAGAAVGAAIDGLRPAAKKQRVETRSVSVAWRIALQIDTGHKEIRELVFFESDSGGYTLGTYRNSREYTEARGIQAIIKELGIPCRKVEERDGEEAEFTDVTELPPGLHVSPGERRVYWNRTRIPFNTNLDFDLFWAVYQRAGAVVPYADLVGGFEREDNADCAEHLKDAPPDVAQALHRIRQACRRIGAPNFIEVIRRRGYRLGQVPETQEAS